MTTSPALRIVALLSAALLALGACGGDDDPVVDAAATSTTSTTAVDERGDDDGGTEGSDDGAGDDGAGDEAGGASTTDAPSTTAGPATTTAARGPAKTHEYSKADSGRTVTVAAGDTIRVSLEECPGCGYRWEQTKAPDAKVLKAEGSSTSGGSGEAGGEPVVGASVTRTFRYAATGAGTTAFTLGYFPPGDSPPEETFTLTVKVA